MKWLVPFALLTSAAVHAQDLAPETPGEFTVSGIRVEGLQRITEGTVFNTLPINIGDRIGKQRVREALRALNDTGYFRDVEFRRDGSDLVIVVQERPSIRAFDVKGNKEIKSDDLMKSLRKAGLASGKILNRSTLEDVRQFLIEQYFSRGRYDVAVSDFEGKLSWSLPLAAMLSIRPFLDALVEACARSERHSRAKELVDQVFEPAVATAQPRYVAIAYRMRALTTGDLLGFGSALEHHRAWGNRFEEARTRLLYGESLRRAKRRAEAREQLSGATASFGAVGAKLWERRARDELRAAGARLPRTASGVALTAQEQRIAALVAEGLANKEIAARLVLSTKTVEGHLRNVFEKLGVTSRTQVARVVQR